MSDASKIEWTDDHVVFDNHGAFWCTHCGTKYEMTLPAPVGVYVAASQAFVEQHLQCPPNLEAKARGERALVESFENPDAWINGPDTGISSETIWSVMTGRRPPRFRTGIPYDPSDFGRCHRLLKAFPEWRARLSEVADKHPTWTPFVREWDRMTALYERDEATGKSEELYSLMRQLVEEVE